MGRGFAKPNRGTEGRNWGVPSWILRVRPGQDQPFAQYVRYSIIPAKRQPKWAPTALGAIGST
jgi:hypothetical protein